MNTIFKSGRRIIPLEHVSHVECNRNEGIDSAITIYMKCTDYTCYLTLSEADDFMEQWLAHLDRRTQTEPLKIIQIEATSEGNGLPWLMGLGNNGVVYERTMNDEWKQYIKPLKGYDL